MSFFEGTSSVAAKEHLTPVLGAILRVAPVWDTKVQAAAGPLPSNGAPAFRDPPRASGREQRLVSQKRVT